MCRWRVTKYRCNHKVKNILLPCSFHRTCTRDTAAILELTADMKNVRVAIRLLNTDPHTSDCEALIAHIRAGYASFFGRGSGHGSDVMASLRDIERYLDGEIEAIGQNVVERFRSAELCKDDCWEGIVLLEREEHEKRWRDMEANCLRGWWE